ncbi:Crp/Fnr family transcriptional regulator [Emticicia fluvialis]|uniref:Crp/Fnr family transcriptional regulator n=1 Tax=Emticicia fluvialis TaxID=2974474 RepID=UPI002165996D|nr:Crp/Fnr family transcriptional regulator [Emticicia fluvialis]
MLFEVLNKIGRFTESEAAFIASKMVTRQYKKNQWLLAEGIICRSISLVVSGAAYQFTLNDIDENIIDLYMANDWVMNYTSFVGQKPSATCIKAHTDCEVLEMSIHAAHELIGISPVFFQLGKVLEQALTRNHYFDNTLTPLQKYNHLLSTRPQLLQQFPLKMIASYLKMTPETLSRVRSIY